MQEIIENYAGWGLGGVAVLLSLVEFSKIKINPWSIFFGWIGDKLMAGMKHEVSELKRELAKEVADIKSDVSSVKDNIEELREEHREDEAIGSRIRILRFADEVYQKEEHSKEYFNQILDDITRYKDYCKAHPDFQNDKTVIATERIEEVYRHCLKTHGFL